MTKYALYEGRRLVRIADSTEGWNFHPYRGNKGFIEVTDEQAERLERELSNRKWLEDRHESYSLFVKVRDDLKYPASSRNR